MTVPDLILEWGYRQDRACETMHLWVLVSPGRWLPVCGSIQDAAWCSPYLPLMRPLLDKRTACLLCKPASKKLTNVDETIRETLLRQYPRGTPAGFLRLKLALPMMFTTSGKLEDLIPPDIFLQPAYDRLVESGEIAELQHNGTTVYLPLRKLREERGVATVSM